MPSDRLLTLAAIDGTSPRELVSVYEAQKRTGVADSTLHAWIRQGRINEYGRGGTGDRTTVLVSLAEVEHAATWRANSVSLSEAARLLGRDRDKTVAQLCDDGLLPYRRFGRTYEIERSAVERMAADRAAVAGRYISLRAAEREFREPRWALERIAREAGLALVLGDRGAVLVRKSELAAALASCIANPDHCQACGRPTMPGRKWHRACAGRVKAREAWDEADPSTQVAKREQARQSTAAHQRVVHETIDALKHAQGLRDANEVARELGRDRKTLVRDPSSVLHHARRLRLGRRVAGTAPHGGTWLFTDADIEVLRRRISESATAVVHREPRRRARWYKARHNSTKMYGRLASELAAEVGVTPGAPPKLSDHQKQRIRGLNDKGLTDRGIALRLRGVSRSTVRRFLVAENLI